MIKLIKLELRKNNLKPYLLAVIGIFLLNLCLGTLFLAVPYLEPNDPSAQAFLEPTMIINMISIVSMSAFAILSSVMHAKFTIEEYTGKKNILLFTYPQKRSSILLSKFTLTFLFVFVLMVIVNIISILSVELIGNAVGLISKPFDNWNAIITLTILFAFVANFVGLIALRIGFYKKSIIVPIVTATLLTSPFGNAVMLLETNTILAFTIVSFILLLVSAILFVGLLKRVNRMECL